jgi:Protein of unknown function (DUF3558)
MRRLLVLVGLLLAGCTTTQPGTPTAGDRPTQPSSTTTETTTTTTTTSVAPARPRNIDLAAVDVCAVVSALPRADLGLDTDRPPLAGDSDLFPGSKDCFANGIQHNLSLLMIAVTSQGAAEFLDGANAEINQTDASGFPLYVLTTQASPDTCFGVLDVNDGQMLYFSYGLAAPGTEPVTPQTTLCQRVPDIARAALSRL